MMRPLVYDWQQDPEAVREMCIRDRFARVVISPVILPIGAITSFLGGPLFLYLLFKEGKRE